MLNKVHYQNLIIVFLLGYDYINLYNLIQEAGGEEKKEVSITLKKLRTKFDNINKLVREKEKELEDLKVYSYIFKFFYRKDQIRRIKKNR